MKFEHRSQPLAPREVFAMRIARYTGLALALVLGALALGVLGYRSLEGMSWIDALVNAAMILGGMGPVNALHTAGGKVFASVYALLSGFLFLISAAVLLAPVIHRFFHHLHLEADESS
jgi:hypothetical protein